MITQINHNIFLSINSLAGLSGAVDAIALFLANGAGISLAIITGLFIIFRESGWGIIRSGLIVFIPVLVAVVYSEALKILFLTPRPSLVMDQVNLLYEYGAIDSFPSSHATVYAALAMSAYFYSKRLGVFLFGGAALIGLARIFVGVHWPLDVVAGFIVGTLVSFVSYVFLIKLFRKTN